MHKWEVVDNRLRSLDNVYRMEVPGGWLYRYDGAIAFVPDKSKAIIAKAEKLVARHNPRCAKRSLEREGSV